MSERIGWRRAAGPALLVTVALSAVLLSRQPPPRLPRTVDLPASPIGLVPEPGWLVRRGSEIPLTPAQTARAAALAAAWQRDTAADSAHLARVGAELDRQQRLDPARQSQLSDRSGRLAALRHAAWDEMWATLSETQRQRIRDLRAGARLEMR